MKNKEEKDKRGALGLSQQTHTGFPRFPRNLHAHMRLVNGVVTEDEENCQEPDADTGT